MSPRSLVLLLLAGCSTYNLKEASYGDSTGGWADDGSGSSDVGDDEWEEPLDTADPEDTAEPEPECDETSPVTLYLSPDDSNSMSSPAQARDAALGSWNALAGIPVRTWEFFNYYSFDYPAPEGADLGIHAALAPDPSAPETSYVLQIGVKSPDLAPEERAPMSLTFVLDTSGSMSGSPMERLKDVVRAVAGQLREGDVVSVVTWNTERLIELESHPVAGPDDETLLAVVDGLDASGGTDLNGGLIAGYKLADQNRHPDRINRLVLISDGGANVGVTDEELIAAHAADETAEGIYMVGVGVGTADTYNDLLMDTVTDAGKGASIFISTRAEAYRMFDERLLSTLDVWARDVQVELSLPPGFEIVSFSGEEYSSDPSEIEPQHLAPDDAMVFHQTIRTCAPEAVTADAAVGVTIRYRDSATFEPRALTFEATFGELLAADGALLRKGAAIYAYAEGLKELQQGGGDAAIQGMLDALEIAEASNPGDADLAEIRQVIEAL